MFAVLLAGFVASLVVLLFRRSEVLYRVLLWSMWDNEPPGPPRLPFIGNSHQLSKILHESLYDLSAMYGPLYRLDICGQAALVVSDASLVKELLSEIAASGRSDLRHLFDVIGAHGIKHGIIIGEGDHWDELRRFTLRHLKDFGFGKRSMEESIMIEVTDFIGRIKSHGPRPISDIKERFTIAVVNALWGIVAGHRSRHDDENTKKFIRSIESLMIYMQNECSPLTMVSPWFAQTFPKLSGYGEYKSRFDALIKDYFLKPVQEHRESRESHIQRDLIDVFLNEIENSGDKPNSAFYKDVGLEHLQQVCFDLYMAGTDTTSSSLAFSFLYISKHLKVQEELYDEIYSITGNSRPCVLADRIHMPYTEAVLAETLRLASISPFVMHRITEELAFKGYRIPSNTMILPNFYYIHHDPKVWADPWDFKPERFLSKDGKVFQKHKGLIPFSSGRRKCLGEGLAKDTMFLYLTNTLQAFQVEFDKNGPENDLKGQMGLAMTPKPFDVIFKERV